jgi:hypothetical protein
MSTKTSAVQPVPCPYCGKEARIMVTMGNSFTGCHFTKECPGIKLAGISPKRFYSVREWNRNAKQAMDDMVNDRNAP